MFKDYNKYLSKSFEVYLFVLLIIFIFKLGGADYFALAIDNPFMIKITNFLNSNWIIRDVFCLIPLLFNQHILISITSNDKSKKVTLYNLATLPILYLFQIYKIKIFGNISFLADIVYLFGVCIVYNRKISIKKFIKVIILMNVFQVISIFARYNYSLEYINNILISFILNLDYMIMLIIIYKLNFMEGGNKLCYQDHHFSSLQKQINLKKLQKESQKQLQNNDLDCKQDKVEKLTNYIYIFLVILWNLFTLICIIFIAKLNDTLIECMFITLAFWLSKNSFGKPFHLKSMKYCFIVSNITYYVLNKITTPLGISIFIPIMLGVGLSYITSKLVKKNYKPLYKGMPKELFEETILKVTDKGSTKYKICYDYYIKNNSAINLGLKYNYSEDGIKKIVKRTNDKVKEL